jgi:hypothetical protein
MLTKMLDDPMAMQAPHVGLSIGSVSEMKLNLVQKKI